MGILSRYWSTLRRVKLLHVLHNLRNYSKLKRNRKLYDQFGIDRTVVQSVSHKSITLPGEEIPWLDRADAKEKLGAHPELKTFDAEIQKQITGWSDNGYMILPGFFTAQADRVNSDLDEIKREKKLDFDYTNSRIMNAWEASELVRKIVHDPEMKRLLSFLLGKPVTPFQTINFFKGSEQHTHSDFIHMTTEPKGFLVAAWIALEDIGDGQGPLHYYPGSHKLPYVLGEDFEHSSTAWTVGDDLYGNFEKKIDEEIREHKLKKEIFHAKKGDVFFWHANLLHGGEEVTNPDSTRKSLVIHYFCEGGVLCYHEITQRPAVIREI
ncbi:MAG TPA: phytanoyl-CoA dioxygenase family protein [Bacteroidia bacterium]|nr:phytanoyl-CoA dioxygenase family protein [Bacteroidia bacterium]